jgi:hypothetical protein
LYAGRSYDYERHGTPTLFAAMEVATGKLTATQSKHRRRIEHGNANPITQMERQRLRGYTAIRCYSAGLAPTRGSSFGSLARHNN